MADLLNETEKRIEEFELYQRTTMAKFFIETEIEFMDDYVSFMPTIEELDEEEEFINDVVGEVVAMLVNDVCGDPLLAAGDAASMMFQPREMSEEPGRVELPEIGDAAPAPVAIAVDVMPTEGIMIAKERDVTEGLAGLDDPALTPVRRDSARGRSTRLIVAAWSGIKKAGRLVLCGCCRCE